MYSHVKTLKEICSLAVMKLGLSRQELPKSLIKELDQMDEMIASKFTGRFYSYDKESDKEVLGISLDWKDGMLKITILVYYREEDIVGLKYETVIKCGVENNLAQLALELFRLPGEHISISNYSIDIARRQLTLFGSCSSDSMPRKGDFKIIMDVRCTGQRTETRVYKKSWYNGEYSLANVLSFYPPDSEMYSESESESEMDLSFESLNSESVESDSYFYAGVESSESDSDGSGNLDGGS